MPMLGRRRMLQSSALGFANLAFAGLLSDAGAGFAKPPVANPQAGDGPLTPRPPHHPARAKRVIFLFMHGGPSQVDTFDPKPLLVRDAGKKMPQMTIDGTVNPAAE